MNWNEEMERFLIECWRRFVQPAGGKTKSVWTKVATAMEEKFIGCGASENACKNRFASLKSDYCLYQQMMSDTSGFGGSARNLTEPEVWREFVAQFPRAEHFRTSPFPHYELMKEVFGDESFTGKNITTPLALTQKKIELSTPVSNDMSVQQQGILHVPPLEDALTEANAPDPRQDMVSRGVWKKPKKPDLATALAQSLKDSMQTVLGSDLFTAKSSQAATSPLSAVVAYLQTSTFAQDKRQLWNIIRAVKEDIRHTDDLKDVI